MGNTSVNRSVNIFLETGEAEKNADRLQKKVTDIGEKIKAATDPKEAAKLTAELKKLEEPLDRAKKKVSGELSASFKDLQVTVNNLGNRLKRMSEQDADYSKTLVQYNQANVSLQEMKREIDGVAKAKQQITNDSKGGSLLATIIGTAAGFSVTQVVGNIISSIKQGISSIQTLKNGFENSSANLSAITGAAGSDLEFLKESAINLSKTGSETAVDYLEAMRLIASAKPELLSAKDDLVKVTEASTLLSRASGIELPDAAKRLTDALNQFGEPASSAVKYVDALAAAAKYGSAEVPEVTDALLQFGTQAKSSNVDIYESAAAIELLAEKGIKGAESGTKLRNVFLALNAVGSLDKKAQDSLKAAGIDTQILSDSSLSLEERLKELGKVQNNNTALVNIFGKENFNAAQIILQNIPRYAQLTDQIKEQGLAATQAATNTDTLTNAWAKFKNIIAARFLSGDNSFLKGLLKAVTDMVEPSKKLVDAFKEQRTNVASLEKDTVPLINRYEELKKKANELGGESKLSKEEQIELQKAISAIGNTIPSAITQFDAYGRAIGISTEKARDFINLQQAILKERNRDAIQEQGLVQKNIENQIILQQKQLSTRDAQNNLAKVVITNARDGVTELKKLSDQEIKDAQNKLKTLQDRLTGVKGILDELKGQNLKVPEATKTETKPPGSNDTGVGTGIGKENLFQKYLLDLTQTAKQLDIFNATQFTKELLANEKHYDDLQEQLKRSLEKEQLTRAEYGNLSIQAEELRARQKAVIVEKEEDRLQEVIKAQRDRQRERTEQDRIQDANRTLMLTKLAAEQQAKMNDALEKASAQVFRDKVARAELQSLKAKGANRLKANKELLDAQELQEIAAATSLYNKEEISEEEFQAKIAQIRNKYQQSKADADLAYYSSVANGMISIASRVAEVFENLATARNQKEDAELARLESTNEKKQKSLQNQLDKGLISREEYDRKVAQLDQAQDAKEKAIKKKQFERQKRLSIIQANINIAQGITSALGSAPPPYNIILAAITAAAGAIELITIAKQKAPEYAKGGFLLHGPSHAEGGIDVIDSRSRRKLAELEGGEAVLSEKTVRNNPGIVAALLDTSLHRNGAPLQPVWKTQPVRQINYSGVQQSIHKTRYFANGGIIPTFSSSNSTAVQDQNNAVMQALTTSITRLNNRLDAGIQASVPLSAIQDQQARMDNIKNDATAS